MPKLATLKRTMLKLTTLKSTIIKLTTLKLTMFKPALLKLNDTLANNARADDQCVQQLDRRGPPLPVGPAEASEASVGPSIQKRPSVWTGPGFPKRAILKPQAPTWRLEYY